MRGKRNRGEKRGWMGLMIVNSVSRMRTTTSRHGTLRFH